MIGSQLFPVEQFCGRGKKGDQNHSCCYSINPKGIVVVERGGKNKQLSMEKDKGCVNTMRLFLGLFGPHHSWHLDGL